MSHPACVVCVAEGKVQGLAAALKAAMCYPLVELSPAETPARLPAVDPAAVVVPAGRHAPELKAGILQILEDLQGAYVPLLADAPEEWGRSTIVLPLPRDGAA